MRKRRLCVIGNSHIVALKDGWPAVPEFGDRFEPTFFSAPGNYLADLRLENNRLIPPDLRTSTLVATTSGGLAYIDVADFDAFLLVGLHLHIRSPVSIYRTHRLLEHIDGKHHHPVTHDALQASIAATMARSAAYRVARLISVTGSGRVIVMPEPLPNPDIVSKSEEATIYAQPFMRDLYGIYLGSWGRLPFSRQVPLLGQPAHTMQFPAFTQPRYSENAGRMWRSKRYASGEDVLHMNGSYGAEILRAAIREIDEAC